MTVGNSLSRVRLGDLCVQDRKLAQPDSLTAKNLPYLSLEHIESNTGRILQSPENLINESIQGTAFLFDARHILYGKLRPYLNKVALPLFSGRCTTELVPLLPMPTVSRRYLAWILRHSKTISFAMKGKTGSRMPRADVDELLGLEVDLPKSLDEQEQIADVIEARYKAIEIAKSSCLRQIELLDTLAKRTLQECLATN